MRFDLFVFMNWENCGFLVKFYLRSMLEGCNLIGNFKSLEDKLKKFSININVFRLMMFLG